MENLSSDARRTLPEFQNFLMKKNLAPKKNVPFLAYWVSWFIEYARKRDIVTTEYQETACLGIPLLLFWGHHIYLFSF